MSIHRYNPRRDANERALIDELEKCGVQCFPVSGKNLPDVICYFNGRWQPLEIKSARGKNRKDEAHVGVPWPTVSNFDQAATWVGLRKIGG